MFLNKDFQFPIFGFIKSDKSQEWMTYQNFIFNADIRFDVTSSGDFLKKIHPT